MAGPVSIVVLNLAALGPCATAAEWYDHLGDQLASQLDLEPELRTFWQAHATLSPLQRWMASLRDVVLPEIGVRSSVFGLREDRPEHPTPNTEHRTPNTEHRPRLVLFVDEIEAVQDLPFNTDEFFAAIRECYNRRTQDPEFNRLTFCLLGTVRISALMRDPRTTPFNIGQRIEVAETGSTHALEPGAGRKRHPIAALLKRALDWITGEPYCCSRTPTLLFRIWDRISSRRDLQRVACDAFCRDRLGASGNPATAACPPQRCGVTMAVKPTA